MRIASISIVPALVLAGCATSSGAPQFTATADASAVLSAEAALLADARERGVWQAFESALADDAVIFIPHAVAGKDRARADPDTVNPKEWAWNAQSVTMACDGSLALVQGEAVTGRDFSADYFSIWERKADGSYELAADAAFYQGDGPDEDDFETIGEASESAVAQGRYATNIARCVSAPGAGPAVKGPTRYSGVAADGSMRWTLREKSDGSSQLKVEGQERRGYRAILDYEFPAPPNR